MSDEDVGQRRGENSIAAWGEAVDGSFLTEMSQGKPFWWTLTTLTSRVLAHGGADTFELAREAALQAMGDHEGA